MVVSNFTNTNDFVYTLNDLHCRMQTASAGGEFSSNELESESLFFFGLRFFLAPFFRLRAKSLSSCVSSDNEVVSLLVNASDVDCECDKVGAELKRRAINEAFIRLACFAVLCVCVC